MGCIFFLFLLTLLFISKGVDCYMLLFYPILLKYFGCSFHSFYVSGCIIIPSASCANRDSATPPPISVLIASCCVPALENTSSAVLKKNRRSEDP